MQEKDEEITFLRNKIKEFEDNLFEFSKNLIRKREDEEKHLGYNKLNKNLPNVHAHNGERTRHTYSIEYKYKSILLYDQLGSYTETAKKLGISFMLVRNWVMGRQKISKAYESNMGTVVRMKGAGRPKFVKNQENDVKAEIQKDDDKEPQYSEQPNDGDENDQRDQTDQPDDCNVDIDLEIDEGEGQSQAQGQGQGNYQNGYH